MPNRRSLLRLIVLLFVLMIGNSFRNIESLVHPPFTPIPEMDPAHLTKLADQVTGAWEYKNEKGNHVLLFIDNYFTHTVYTTSPKKFVSASGGKYTVIGGKLTVNYEFNSADKNLAASTVILDFALADADLSIAISGEQANWKRLDAGTGALAGSWQISGRMENNKMVERQPGIRKTIKILSGTRFQWAAINTETKEFGGTGGGTYTFKNGKYTESIDFFSRDSSRVGASLSFEGTIKDDKWVHKGLSSKGEPIHEVWSRAMGSQ